MIMQTHQLMVLSLLPPKMGVVGVIEMMFPINLLSLLVPITLEMPLVLQMGVE